MRTYISTYTDVLIKRLRNRTLEIFLERCKTNYIRVYIPFGVRKEVEESLYTEDETEAWHNLLKQGLSQGVIIKSRHKYDFERPYKILFSRLSSINPELNEVQRHLVTLSLQVGMVVDTKNKQIIRTISQIKTTTHLQKYATRLISKDKINTH